MDGPTFLDDLRDDHETPLSRLGSSKSVYALTGGEMDGDRVKTATANELAALASVLESWAESDDEVEVDGGAADLFAAVASFAKEQADDVAGDTKPDSDPEGTAIAAGLQNLADTDAVARTGALAGGLLALGKLTEQLVGFFVGDADRKGADEFRSLRSAVEGHRDDTATTLEQLCDGDEDWETAASAASEAIESSYDWYVETLEGMGVKPKNVC